MGRPSKYCPDEEKLIRLYCEEELTGYEVAEHFDACFTTIYKWLEALGIDRRPPARFSEGQDNPRWTGWSQSESDTAFYASMEWKEVRAEEKERADHECEDCGDDGYLVVHHITPIQEGGAKLDKENLEVLCASCHSERHD